MRGFLPLVAIAAALPCAAADLALQLSGGSALQLPTRLTIRQEGARDLRFTAHWETRPFEDSPYYAVRAGLWKGRGAWELQFVHHKAYLTNPPAEVERFEVTHGFNLLTLGRAGRLRSGFEWRAGIGPVITHTESVVRGRFSEGRGTTFPGAYDLGGGAAMLGAGRRVPVWRGTFVSADVQAIGAWVRVKVARGTADVPNVALHGMLGIGWGSGGS